MKSLEELIMASLEELPVESLKKLLIESPGLPIESIEELLMQFLVGLLMETLKNGPFLRRIHDSLLMEFLTNSCLNP